MKLDKAIKVIENILDSVEPGDPQEEQDALELGIEALKRIRDIHARHPDVTFNLLPGETPLQ